MGTQWAKNVSLLTNFVTQFLKSSMITNYQKLRSGNGELGEPRGDGTSEILSLWDEAAAAAAARAAAAVAEAEFCCC